MIPKAEIERILLEVIKRFLIPKHEALGMKASGKWIESLEVVGNVIRGQKYTEQLVNGRAGGSLPPINAIENWVKAKFGYSGNEARQTAWAVAKSIEKKGTTWHQKGGSDLLEVLETQEVKDFINQELGKYITADFKLQIQRQLQTI
jgi:hypothetical protein